MLVKANQTFRVTKPARINKSKGRIVPGGKLETLTPPEKRDGVDTVMVRYTGQDGDDEASSGTKFRIKVPSLMKCAVQI